MSNAAQFSDPKTFSGYQGACFATASETAARDVIYAKSHRCTFLGLAATQFIFGICLIVIGIWALSICVSTIGCSNPDPYLYYYYGIWTMIGTNIWGGALVSVFAAFGFVQVCKPSSCTIMTNLTLSILGAIITPGFLGVEICTAILSFRSVPLVVLHSTASGIYLITFILFVVSASFAGKARGCCCGCRGQQEVMPIVLGTDPQVVTFANCQAVVIQGPPQNVPSSSYIDQPPQYSVHNPGSEVKS